MIQQLTTAPGLSNKPGVFLCIWFESINYFIFGSSKAPKDGGQNQNRNGSTLNFLTMLAFCTCPLPTSIGAIPAFTCGEDFGQIQKIYFQRRQASAPFADVTAAGTLANWTAFFAASDATKVVATPFFDSFQIPGSEAITEGGDDNTTLDGTPVVIGATNPRATGSFRSLPGSIFAALQLLNCEPNLTAYFINEFEKIIGYSANGTTVEGFTSTNFFIGDKSILGKNTQDKYAFGFGMRSGWASKVKVVTPVDFLPRTAF